MSERSRLSCSLDLTTQYPTPEIELLRPTARAGDLFKDFRKLKLRQKAKRGPHTTLVRCTLALRLQMFCRRDCAAEAAN